MSSQWQLDQQYAALMSSQPFGVALYRPLSSSTFKPGSCGYFDKFGSWNPICQLDDPESLRKKGFSAAPEEIELAPVEANIKWGPKVSKNMKAKKMELSAGIALASGLPVHIRTLFNYSTEIGSGAILLTKPPIVHERFYYESPFKNWVRQNAREILTRRPEVKERGMWIVTSTHSTPICEINLCQNGRRGTQVGFSSPVVGLSEVGPIGEWYNSEQQEGWNRYGADEPEGDDRKVVFFGGLKFQFSWFVGKKLKPESRPIFRGSHDSKGGSDIEAEIITTVLTEDDPDEGYYVVDCEEHLSKEPVTDEPGEGAEW